jgi:hypothetical protein
MIGVRKVAAFCIAVSVVAVYDANVQNQALAKHLSLASLTKRFQKNSQLQSQLQIYPN